MAWFIAKTPNHLVRLPSGATFRFKSAEYRTTDADELLALRADPGCSEVITKLEQREILRPWVVNVSTGRMHDLGRRQNRCGLSAELLEAAADLESEGPMGATDPWELYRREEDARRWHPDVSDCKFCIDTDERRARWET